MLKRRLRWIDGRLGHVAISIDNRLGARGAAGLRYVRRASEVVSRRGTGAHLRRLGRVASLDKGHAVDRRRGRRRVVPQVCEGRLALEVLGDHRRLDGSFMTMGRRSLDILIIVIVAPAVEIAGTFVFGGAAMKLISCDKLSHITRGIFVELLIAAEDEYGHIDGTEHR